MSKPKNTDTEKQSESTPWLYLGRWLVFSLLALAFLIFALIAPTIDFFLDKSDGKTFYSPSGNYAEILLFSLGLIGAGATLAISLWRGGQIYTQIARAEEQIDEAQEQNRITQFQNAIEMATEKDNAGRCAAGLRVLASIYKKIEDKPKDKRTADDELDKQSIHSVALYVLSLEKEKKPIEEDKKPLEKNEKRVSSTARQWALDILVRGGFLSYDAHVNNEKKNKAGNDGMELSIKDSTIEKDFSSLYIGRKSIEENENIKKRKTLNLSNFSLNECDFSNADLSGINLSDANFENANFTDTKMFGVNLSRTKLINAEGLFINNLEWAYCTEQPQILIFGWKRWILEVEVRQEHIGIRTQEEHPLLKFRGSSDQGVKAEALDFMIRFSTELSVFISQETKPPSPVVMSGTSSGLIRWNNFISLTERVPYLREDDFWKAMTPEVWDYLKCATKLIEENPSTKKLTIRETPSIKSWDEWKKFVRKAKSKPEGAKDDVWDYMQRLAEEDAPYPPSDDHPEASKI